LRVAARRPATYWIRFAAALIGCVLAACLLNVFSNSAVPSGAVLFRGLAILAFSYAAIAGLQATNDSISGEKREGTLGLLFLTDLKGRDVVYGKLVAASIHLFYGLLAVAPVLAVALPLGGVTGREFFRAVLVALDLLFFFTSVGLAASSLCRLPNRALVLAVATAAMLVVGCPLCARFRLLPAGAMVCSPALGCFLAFDQYYAPALFWLNALVTQLYAWSFISLACWVTPRAWQDVPTGKVVRPRGAPSPRQVKSRARLLDANAYLWRASRPEAKRALVWVLLLLVAAVWLRAPFDPQNDLVMLLVAGTLLKCWLAGEASWMFSDDRRSGAFELLLSTPLGADAIIRGQRAALWRQFAAPVTALLLANSATLVMEIWRAPTAANHELLIWVHIIAGVSLVIELLALAWVGMWQGLIHHKSTRAALLALARILAIPYAFFFAVLFIYSLGGPAAGLNWIGLLIFPNFFGVATNFFFALEANTKLRAAFRTVASEGYTPPVRRAGLEDEPPPALVEAK